MAYYPLLLSFFVFVTVLAFLRFVYDLIFREAGIIILKVFNTRQGLRYDRCADNEQLRPALKTGTNTKHIYMPNLLTGQSMVMYNISIERKWGRVYENNAGEG